MKAEDIHLLMAGLPGSTKLIETHISWVLLTKEYVYKIKKPLNYGFLNFSELQSRKFYCEEEVRLNRRLCKEIYLGVAEIREKNGNFSFDNNSGEVVAYAVQMKKLDGNLEMDKLLGENAVTENHISTIIDVLVPFHSDAELIRTEFSQLEMQNTFNDILTIEEELSGIPERESDFLRQMVHRSDHFLASNVSLLEARIEKGYIRDVHGDLHSKNIFLYEEPILFDCIEFNAAFRQIDLLNEIAFFCMDLEAREHPELSEYFIQEYVEQMNDEELFHEELFVYYKCARANVRAKVNALRLRQATNVEDRKLYLSEFSKYLNMMESYSLQFSASS